MYGEPFIGVDFTDLIRGEGDWRNMQDVVRRTFRQCLETQKQQSEKIAYVTAQLMATKEELNRRPTWEDIERLVETKMMMKTSRGGVPSAVTGGIEDLRLEVANVKASLETKVNMRTLENILSKKVDRSDLAVRSLADSSAMTVQNDVKQLKEGFLDLQSRVSVVESDIHKVVDENDFHQQKRDLLIVRTQVDNIYRSMNDFPTKDHIKHLLDQKVNHSDIPTLIGGKADGERVHNTLASFEAALERHEKQLTSLRLSANDPTVFREEAKSLQRPAWTARHSKSSKHADQSMNDSRMEEKHGSKKKDLEELMREGRVEAMLSKVYQQMCDLSFAHDLIHKQLQKLEKDREQLQEQVNQSANKQAVELLAVVVEEQRLRVDSVIQGSVKIKPIYKDLKRLEAELQLVSDFIQSPAQKTLKEVVDTFNQRIQDTNDHLHTLHASVHEQCIPMQQTLKSRVELIETIWQAYEVDRDRLQYLLSVVDFSDTPYSNLREMARSVGQLYFMIQGDPLLNQLNDKDQGILAQSHGCLLNRLRDLEEEDKRLIQQVSSCQRALLAVKAVLNSDGKAPEGLKNFSAIAPTPSSTSSASILGMDRSTNSTPKPGKLGKSGLEGHEGPGAKKLVVDFDVALGQLLSSLDDVAVATHSVPAVDTSTEQPWSLSGIDERLEQLKLQKQELRKKLLSEI